MKRHLFLSTMLASTLLASQASALDLSISSCKYFNLFCSDNQQTAQAPIQNIEAYQPFSFSNFFNSWQLPPLPAVFNIGNGDTAQVQNAQLQTQVNYSPNTIPTNKAGSENTINSSDFGLGVKNDGSTPKTSGLLTKNQILSAKANLDVVLTKCADGSTACISQVTKGQTTPDSKTGDTTTPTQNGGLSNYNPNGGGFWSQNGGEETDNKDEMAYSSQQIQSLNNSYSSVKSPLSSGSVSNVDFGAGSGDCSGNGIINKAANLSILDTVKFDTSRICKAFGKKITVVDAKRGCSGPSRHCFGEAIDFEINSYGNRQQQALLIVSFIALGYDIGSYEDNFPLHADNEKSSYWKTWSRWAHKNGQAPLPYQQQVVDALNIIGMPARSAHEFRSTYGKPSKQQLMQKAQAAIRATGNQRLIDGILSGQALSPQ